MGKAGSNRSEAEKQKRRCDSDNGRDDEKGEDY
jgi:hypothetical protein